MGEVDSPNEDVLEAPDGVAWSDEREGGTLLGENERGEGGLEERVGPTRSDVECSCSAGWLHPATTVACRLQKELPLG